MNLITTIINLLRVLISDILLVIEYVVYLITNIFTLFGQFLAFITGSSYLSRFFPTPLQPLISIIFTLVVIMFIVRAISWAIHLIRG